MESFIIMSNLSRSRLVVDKTEDRTSEENLDDTDATSSSASSVVSDGSDSRLMMRPSIATSSSSAPPPVSNNTPCPRQLPNAKADEGHDGALAQKSRAEQLRERRKALESKARELRDKRNTQLERARQSQQQTDQDDFQNDSTTSPCVERNNDGADVKPNVVSSPQTPSNATPSETTLIATRRTSKSRSNDDNDDNDGEKARILRLIGRIRDAEQTLVSKQEALETRISSSNHRRLGKHRAIQEFAESKLRRSQLEMARGYYQERLSCLSQQPHQQGAERSVNHRATPLEISRVVSTLLPKYSNRRKSLQHELDELVSELTYEHPEQMRQLSVDVRRWKHQISALPPGTKASGFSLVAHNGKRTTVSFPNRQRLVITFYHGGWSPLDAKVLHNYQTQLYPILIRSQQGEDTITTRLIAIAEESFKSTQKTAAATGARFPLLSDPDARVAEAFGIAHADPPSLCCDPGRPSSSFPIGQKRSLAGATFVIDTDGTILRSFVDCDPTKRVEPSDILDALPTQSTTTAVTADTTIAIRPKKQQRPTKRKSTMGSRLSRLWRRR